MHTSFTLLLVEDSSHDAELVLETLRGAGFDPTCRQVDSKEAYLKELTVSPPDIILSDFSLPQFDGKAALQLLKATGLEIPFIIVSGCIGEDMAVECMKAGASDYLLKDRLGRLPHAVSQALERKRLMEEKRQAEQRLFLETFHDPLTGLPNRFLFLDRVNRVILRNRRDTSRLFAVVYLSLEGIEIVNNSLGPSAADRLLIDVSRRILMRVRSADTLARLGGEDFVFLLDNLKSEDNATRVAERVRQEFSLPFSLEGQDLFLTATLGITLSATGYDEAEHVLRDATTAVHRAKALGRSGFAIFDQVMHDQAMTRLKLETDLRQAVERHEFRLHYQPLIQLATGQVTGFEALIRWQHPDQGLMMPHAFLTAAAELGMLPSIGEWSCEEACRQLRAWQNAFPNRVPLTMSVNLSTEQFSNANLASTLHDVVVSTRIEPGSLKVEITESEIMENPKAVSDILYQLKREGIEACLDDFGTGYSSLSYLQQLPITFIKIDQSFVRRLGVEDDALAIVKTIVVLAHQLGRKVIAEGVETSEHLNILRSLDCEYAQGYLFAKPLPEAEARNLLTTNRRW
jgi:diguanylate cyclase (GGDEF)-like protein